MRRTVATTLAVFLVLAAGACSKGSDVATPTTAKPVETTQGPGTTKRRSTTTTVDDAPATTRRTGTTRNADDPFCQAVNDNLGALRAAGDNANGTIDDLGGFLVALRALQKVAPPDIVDQFDVLVAKMAPLEGLPAAEQQSKLLDLIGDRTFFEALLAVPVYVETTCGVSISEKTTSTTSGGGTIGTDSPTSNIDKLEAFLDARYASEPWRKALASFSISVLNGAADITVGASGNLAAADAVEACNAIATWAAGAFTSAKVSVNGAGGTPLATKSESATTCTSA